MKALIVDDDLHKEDDLANLIESQYPQSELHKSRSYQSGLKEALTWKPEIILLDMSMPLYDVGVQSNDGPRWPFAGRDLLRELARKRVQSRVVVVTQYEAFGGKDDRVTLEELKMQLRKEFPRNYVTTVYYHVSQSAWRGELTVAIDKCIEAG